MNRRGFFIALEGTEGVGKSTQSLMLSEALSARKKPTPWTDLIITGEPGGTQVGWQIRKMISESEIDPLTVMLLFQADRAEHTEKLVKPHLANNSVVICDRSIYSSIAYQHYGQGYDLSNIEFLNNISASKLKPDLTIWLDGNVEFYLNRANERDGKDADMFQTKNIEFHSRVHEGYISLSKTEHNFERVKISADQSKESIHKKVLNIVIEKLGVYYGLDW